MATTLREVDSGAGAGTSGSAVNTAGIKRQISRLEEVIEEGTAPKPRAVEKDRLASEERELEGLLAEGMPTRDEMRYPTRNPGAVRKHMEWCKRNNTYIKRYVEIQKILRPFEPKSIENLRKDK